MRIIYLHQYFNTPSMPGFGTRSYEMARRLVQWGHEVDMITTIRQGDGVAGDEWTTTEEAGIRIHWLPVPYSNSMGFRDRVRAFVKFAWKASWRAGELDGDLVFATSTPLTIAIPAIYAQWKRKTPMVFEVRDLWPEAPVQLGFLKNRALIWGARLLEKMAYDRAAHIVALTPGMKDGVVERGVPENRVTVIPNSCDLDLFSPDIDGERYRRKLRTEGKFVLLYFGTHGVANGLHFVLDAAAELKKRGNKRITFILHGRGMQREELIARGERERLTNVVFSEPFSGKREVAQLVASADVCMTIYKNVPILYTCSPNKMFDAFAGGKPVLTNMPGWLRELVEENEAGVFVPPDDPKAFADAAVRLMENPELCRKLGYNARRLAENRFARDELAKQLESILSDVGSGRSAATIREAARFGSGSSHY